MRNKEVYNGIVVEDYFPLAKKYANRYYRAIGLEFEELQAEFYTALIKAAIFYKPNKGTVFATVALMYFKNTIRTLIRKRDTWCVEANAVNFDIEHIKEETTEREHFNMDLEKIRSWVTQLPIRERYIINSLYLDMEPKTLQQIGKKLKISHQFVDQLRHKAIKRLQQKVM